MRPLAAPPARARQDLLTVQVVELPSQVTLKLPPDIAQGFHPADRFVLCAEGNTLHLKRVSAPLVTDIVAAAPPVAPGVPMSSATSSTRPREPQAPPDRHR